MWPILMELLVALVLSGIALGSAHDWASTGRPIGAYVTDCVAADGYQCDYHWATGTGVFAGRLSGEQWPDGLPVRMWVNPNDPADVEATKHVLASAVWFPVLGVRRSANEAARSIVFAATDPALADQTGLVIDSDCTPSDALTPTLIAAARALHEDAPTISRVVAPRAAVLL